ncbi:MAG: Cobalamin import ATP-binding protein BtuD [Methanosaeta sp. PtaB.Bin039]|nr:MAG: Cobalamin import ATP-binding protein BtuD [Methanosaeta sp. PtaB.Bin039]
MLAVRNLSFSYGQKSVLLDINLDCKPMLTAIIGPNATGKSTFLKCIAGLLKHRGSVILNGKRIYDGDSTGQVSYLPQDNGTPIALTVLEAVLLGMHQSLSWRVSQKDLDLAFGVLEDLGIEELSTRLLNQLSGGQQQMVSIAQSLVREPQVLLMDEPTSSLDLYRQLEIFNLIKKVTYEKNIITLVALHDLNLAARYADRMVVMSKGTIYDAGEPYAILTEDMIKTVYGVHADVYMDRDGLPVVVPKVSSSPAKRIQHRDTLGQRQPEKALGGVLTP